MPRPARPWFRLYSDILDNDKADKLKPQLYRYWIKLMAIANVTTPRGTLPPMSRIAFRLRVTEPVAKGNVYDLMALGFIDERQGVYVMHDWEEWQADRDVAPAKRDANVTPTSQINHANVTLSSRENHARVEKSREEKRRVEAEAEKTREAVAPPVQQNIFRETERAFGRNLSAYDCDHLRELETTYPEEIWRYALRECADLNKKTIRYMQRVCENNANGVPDERGRDDNRSQRSGSVQATERLTPGPGLEKYERDYAGRKLVDPWGDSGGPVSVDQSVHAAGLQAGRGDAQEGSAFSSSNVYSSVPTAGRQEL